MVQMKVNETIIWFCDWCGAANHVVFHECQECDGGKNASVQEREAMAAALSGWLDPKDKIRDL
jgi:hypothetical protein